MHKTASSLARDLGVSRQILSRYRKEAWFPELPCTTEVARAAILKHAKRATRKVKRRAPQPPSDASEHQGARQPQPGEPSPLRSADDPVSILTAALHVARDRLAAAHEAHRDKGEEFGTRDFEDLKRCISELINAREEAESRGELVTRDVARSACASIARMSVEAFDRVAARMAAQVDAWLGDPEWRGLPQRERAIAVRAWTEQVVGEARNDTADRIDRMIRTARKEVAAQR